MHSFFIEYRPLRWVLYSKYGLGEDFGKFEIENLVEKCFRVLFQILQELQTKSGSMEHETVTCLKHFLIAILNIAKFDFFFQ